MKTCSVALENLQILSEGWFLAMKKIGRKMVGNSHFDTKAQCTCSPYKCFTLYIFTHKPILKPTITCTNNMNLL